MPRSDDVPAPHSLELAGADGLTLRADGWGDHAAPAVVFLHGGGQTRHAWAGTARALAADGRYALCLDLRGHGESEWSKAPGGYRLERFAADLLAVSASLPAPPALVGASLGGLAILVAAENAPAPLAPAAVLVDIAPRIERAGAERIIRFMTGRPEGFASLEEAAETIAAYTKQRRRPPDPESLAKNLRQGPDGRWRWHWDPRFMSPDGPAEVREPERLSAAAQRLSCPTLVVRGRESDLLSDAGASALVDQLPDAHFVDVRGAGHMVAGDRNDAFTAAVQRFLDAAQPR